MHGAKKSLFVNDNTFNLDTLVELLKRDHDLRATINGPPP